MRYDVKVVADDRLPDGHDWMLLSDDDATCLFVRESRTIGCPPGACASCPVLASADDALRLIEQRRGA